MKDGSSKSNSTRTYDQFKEYISGETKVDNRLVLKSKGEKRHLKKHRLASYEAVLAAAQADAKEVADC
jgi:hypothetical protein